MTKRGWLERKLVTLGVMLYSLVPPGRGEPVPLPEGGVHLLEPRDLLGGVERFLDQRGDLIVFFPGCEAPAAPFLLFRLKRSGFSCSRAEASPEGLLISARR